VTFHQRLEAHQNLRKWLEINAPTLVEALLAPGKTPRELQHLLRDYKR
jgi:cell pole-organizing protein PopZ